MKIKEIIKNAFGMPINSPAYPRGPYKFVDREYLIITYQNRYGCTQRGHA
jgi:acetoacetate decarboxylase